MPETHPRLAILGPGLIGASVALAARRRWPAIAIVEIDRGDPLDAVHDAQVVVLSMPVDAIIGSLPRLAAIVPPQALILDTGSTKRAIMTAAATAGLPHFVGGHPMAGGTTAGPAAARADLFDGKTWFLVHPAGTDAVRRAVKFVEALGAVPMVLTDGGEQHDRLMAALSHLPQLTASALMTVVANAAGHEHLGLAGNGLRDTTRLAASGAAMWASVLATNSREIRPLLQALAAELTTLSEQLDDRDAVQRFFDAAAHARSFL